MAGYRKGGGGGVASEAAAALGNRVHTANSIRQTWYPTQTGGEKQELPSIAARGTACRRSALAIQARRSWTELEPLVLIVPVPEFFF